MRFAKLTGVLFGLLVFGLSLLGHAETSKREPKLVKDPTFQKRLVVQSIYQSRPGDTLKSLALFLYEHETWWTKIKAENANLKSYAPHQQIPVNTLIRYWAPQIGSTYVVQPNDWLIRIVQWKYGASDHWQEIYQTNAGRISNPNLIHPGDVLTLQLDGTVRQAKSGEILVQGFSPSTPAMSESSLEQPVENRPLPGAPVLALSSPAPEKQDRCPASDPVWMDFSPFSIGFFVGSLILLFIAGGYRFSRSTPPDLNWDKSLIPRDEGDLEKPSGYELISRTSQKKVLTPRKKSKRAKRIRN